MPRRTRAGVRARRASATTPARRSSPRRSCSTSCSSCSENRAPTTSNFVPLSPWYRFRFQDGSTFDYGGTIEDTLAEIRRISPEDADGYLRLVEHSRKLFDAGFTELADQPFHDSATMFDQIPRLVRTRAYRTVWQLVTSTT